MMLDKEIKMSGRGERKSHWQKDCREDIAKKIKNVESKIKLKRRDEHKVPNL